MSDELTALEVALAESLAAVNGHVTEANGDGHEAGSDVLRAALAAYDAGLCTIRPRVDGTKAPLAVSGHGKLDATTGKRQAGWEAYQTERPSRHTVEAWFASWPGLGLVCGAVSGGLELFELEGRAVAEGVGERLVALIVEAGLVEVWERIIDGYAEATPSDGFHALYRVVDGPPARSTKLAMRPATVDELAANPDERLKTLVETKGEGGFVITAPSNGTTHPSGRPWVLRAGGFATIATITAAERDALHDVARRLDQCDRTTEGVVRIEPAGRAQHRAYAGGPVGASWVEAVIAHLAATDTMAAAIVRYGWRDLDAEDTRGCPLYERPGQPDAGRVGGLINANGRLVVFSTSTPFVATLETDRESGRGPTYDLLDVYAAYEHRGDRMAAAHAIAEATGIYARYLAERDPFVAAGITVGATGLSPPGINPVTGELAPPLGWRDLIVRGGDWIRSGTTAVEPLWGDEVDVLAAVGQPTLIVGENGAGKTTLAHHLMLGAVGAVAFDVVLGWPVRPLAAGRTVLYLASDRPEQARLALRRLVADDTVGLLDERLRVWRGPPPTTLSERPTLLLEMAEHVGAGLVVIDSAKDMAPKLSDDNIGAAVNGAHQHLVANDIDVIALHHPRKRGRDNAADRPTLDDLYGSAWLAAGAGSVLFLIGEPTSTEGLQLKTPNGREANFRFHIDAVSGALDRRADDPVLAAVVDAGPDGIRTKDVARWVLSIDEPTEAQTERIRRRLRVLEGAGSITTTGVGRATRWVEA